MTFAVELADFDGKDERLYEFVAVGDAVKLTLDVNLGDEVRDPDTDTHIVVDHDALDLDTVGL